MLTFIPYEKETEIQDLPQISSPLKKYTAICPHPTLADHSRNFFSHSAEVLTISRFMKDQLALAYPEGEISIKGKAELLLFLSAIWRQQNGPKDIETFKQAFKLFTELRSFTLDLNLIEEILNEFSPEVANALKMFWLVTEQLELVDEHKASVLLSEAYRTIDNPVNEKASLEEQGETYLFWGFRHLSALQVDLIKALSLRHEILIPLPKSVFFTLSNSDWPSWLGAKELKEEKSESYDVKTFFYSKGRLAEKIATVCKRDQKSHFLLCTETPTLEQYAEISVPHIQFRSNIDLWKGDFEKISNDLFESTPFSQSLESFIQTALKQQKFPQLKILLLYKTIYQEWLELSSKHSEPTFFDLAIFREMALLRLPRNFLYPLEKEFKGSIYSLRESDTLNNEMELFICASSTYEDLKGGSEAYNSRVMEFLRAIGPIQRKEFIFSFVKNNLESLLRRKTTTLLFEEGLTEHMLCWGDILKNFKLVPETVVGTVLRIPVDDPLAFELKEKKIQSLSASSLQSYLDCPRKFYYSYIEKVKGRSQFESSLRSDELGTLEHKIIELYFCESSLFDEELHDSLVKKVLKEYLEKQKKQLPHLERENAYWELKNYSQNGIQALLKLKQYWPELKFSFEVKLNKELAGFPVKGSADCVIECAEGWGLLDFKRSEASIPSKVELETFKSIQVPFYLQHLFPEEREILFWGHLNLSQINESQVFAKDESVRDKLMVSNFLEVKKLNCYLPNRAEYLNKEAELLSALKSETQYLPRPLDKETCKFCDLSNICPRGVVHENT